MRPRVSDTTPDRAKRPGKPRRIRFGVHGVEILDHPRNKPELVGTVVPWERVSASGSGMFAGFALLDERYRPIWTGVMESGWGLSDAAMSKAARVKRRWTERIYRQGRFEYAIDTPPTNSLKLIGWVIAVVLSVAFPAFGWWRIFCAARASPWDAPRWLELVTLGGVLAAIVAYSVPFVFLSVMQVLLARRSVRHARIVPWQIQALLVTGEHVRIEFRDVERVRLSGRYCSLRSRDGREICLALAKGQGSWILRRLGEHVNRGTTDYLSVVARGLSMLVILALLAGTVAVLRSDLLPPMPPLVWLFVVFMFCFFVGVIWLSMRARQIESNIPAPWLEPARTSSR